MCLFAGRLDRVPLPRHLLLLGSFLEGDENEPSLAPLFRGERAQAGRRKGAPTAPAARFTVTEQDLDRSLLARLALIREPVAPQASFQPGSTEENPINRRRFLAYTLEGCIQSKAEDDYATIEVLFHDTIRHPARVPHFTDLHGINLGKGRAREYEAGQRCPRILQRPS